LSVFKTFMREVPIRPKPRATLLSGGGFREYLYTRRRVSQA